MAIDLSSLNLATLGSGSVVAVEEVERLTGFSRRSRDYPMACLAVRDALMVWFRAERGVLPTIVIRHDEVCVLAPREAVEYNRRMGESLLRRFRATYRRNAAVEAGELTAEERVEHRRDLEIQGRYIQAMRTTRKEVRPTPEPRNMRTC